MLENEDEQKIEEYLTLDFYFYSNVMYLFFISKNSCFTDVLKKTLKKRSVVYHTYFKYSKITKPKPSFL